MSFTLLPQFGGLVFASGLDPNATSVPSFRALVSSDLPAVPVSLITGVLSVAHGGTNSGTPLAGSRLMQSNSLGTEIVEAPALGNGEFFLGSTGLDPVVGTLTSANNDLLVIPGPGTLELQVIINVSNAVGVLDVTRGGTGRTLPFTPNQVVMASSTGESLVSVGSMTDGQVIAGVSGGAPVPTTIVAGNGMEVLLGFGLFCYRHL